ncbi:hypothetical protein M752DRAFT_46237 [Aspergillus phoenicis ATCC 13157]|uniref:Uncharacterized protein n=1 Tax=Aspergillus phoenicis ATCC 13157 TaxID=1353007 RepID=A0A370PCN7_ASPPH|nr:hypothetical protein M752DRAFT_46237 [Aspergillus phoenicis ATCC 13157]
MTRRPAWAVRRRAASYFLYGVQIGSSSVGARLLLASGRRIPRGVSGDRCLSDRPSVSQAPRLVMDAGSHHVLPNVLDGRQGPSGWRPTASQLRNSSASRPILLPPSSSLHPIHAHRESFITFSKHLHRFSILSLLLLTVSDYGWCPVLALVDSSCRLLMSLI